VPAGTACGATFQNHSGLKGKKRGLLGSRWFFIGYIIRVSEVRKGRKSVAFSRRET
jgi:hypothetical protein